MIPRQDFPRPIDKREANFVEAVAVYHERRIIDLETRIAALEAALDKLTGEGK